MVLVGAMAALILLSVTAVYLGRKISEKMESDRTSYLLTGRAEDALKTRY
jgi:putative Ca2+/H+ antiporter (TMEM165/GDT1 family)